ncbi:3-oxosteroid 1-dehydrogenase [Acidocella aquatica]|uniref:3-oxosteroid 1-dehydrogenase n=1 Tax=Acidocella aquatica TaxID=1922313 RepID=A0ABQ6A1L3_9PROT|nr:FAD-binding protein [Acidocella aquatica]GLR65498.1 3-oxosteroid 1-dehydrogenase [Acidocella aquatica]
MTTEIWDKTVDLLIVGSGAGSFPAALLARDHGLEPLIVEKCDKIGGTTAISGGVLWIPGNHLMARAGIADSHERAREYLDAAIWHDGPATTPARREAFLRHGPEAIEYLERKGMKLKRPKLWPDYHSDLPGAEQTSRSLLAELFDLNELGPWKTRLALSKMPPVRFTMDELSSLILVKRLWSSRLAALRLALRMLRMKFTGQDLRGGGAAWQGRMLQIAVRENIPIWTETPVIRLLTDQGRVIGAEATHQGRTMRIHARRGVLLNSGGFARNAAMRAQYGRQPVYPQTTNAGPGDTGEMIEAGISLGAAVDCMDEALWGVSSLTPGEQLPPGATAADGTPLPFGHHFDISLPHAIMVDQNGMRFTNEAASYMEVGQNLYRRHAETGKGIPAWAIIESRHRERYPWGSAAGKTPKNWLSSGYMKKAATLDALARECGIDPIGLRATVNRFNGFCRDGIDADFARGAKAFDNSHGDPTVTPNPNLGAIENPPFYAVAIYPGDVSTWGGLVTDEHARVLQPGGTPIKGLYATGTATASLCGRTYPGAGASIGPALTFGYIAALHIVADQELSGESG